MQTSEACRTDFDGWLPSWPLWLVRVALVAVIAVGLHETNCSHADDIEQPNAFNQLCVLQDLRINEASGIARSTFQQDCVWLHNDSVEANNDSGDEPRLFLVNIHSGMTKAILRLPDERTLDCEDMCSFVCDGTAWLLIGDIGDNAKNRGFANLGAKRPPCRLLLIEEPKISPDTAASELIAVVHRATQFVFDDGARDCESVAVDTDRREILLIAKSKSQPLDCGIYRIPLNLQKGASAAQAEKLGTIDLRSATAMDISPDNTRMIVVSSSRGMIIERTADESWGDASQREARVIQLPPQKQGETVCFTEDRDVVLLTSEHPQQPMWRLKLSLTSSD